MTKQIVLIDPIETESVCTTCKHFNEMDDAFYCRFFDAFLSEETLFLPCDFTEPIE